MFADVKKGVGYGCGESEVWIREVDLGWDLLVVYGGSDVGVWM